MEPEEKPVAFMAFLVAVPAAAQSTWAVWVAVLNYPNFIEREKNGTVSGFAAEYLNDIVDYIVGRLNMRHAFGAAWRPC